MELSNRFYYDARKTRLIKKGFNDKTGDWEGDFFLARKEGMFTMERLRNIFRK